MIDNLDNRIAEDMVDETPVFGSVGDASDATLSAYVDGQGFSIGITQPF